MDAFPVNPDRLEAPVRLLDDTGTAWLLRKRRIELRVIRRLIKERATTVVLGESGGTRPRPVADDERPVLWERIKDGHPGTGGNRAAGGYLAHEFRTETDRRMLYVEEHC
ncbi:hypothetical protein [Kitasatospora viridis]|uniref:Uncharacterized protein n=1 Tax=Kitasatospora viridis TaxID=281105 RepID=A0A561TTG7_9ACTN|nr:hypothetical protein [Kitasatospora viridis]TWF90403.1 hypothetical protein FHX73_13447 [Kitasatospora viridis]